MSETVVGTTGHDSLVGAGNDVLQGLAGNDTLTGMDGDDTLQGGVGDDTYVITQSGTTWVEIRPGEWVPVSSQDLIVENAGEGTDTILDLNRVGATLGDNIENYVGGLGRGNALNNVMTALGPVDNGWTVQGSDSWFWGGDGNDTLNGASGDDSLTGDAGDDVLIGNVRPDEIPGASDQDSLDGGAGADTMAGGLGMDTYWVDDLGDVVTEDAAPGSMSELDAYYSYHWDTVNWTGQGQYLLADNVEFLHLRSDAPEDGFGTSALGNAAGNVIYSDFGSYTVLGGEVPLGEVSIDGGAGDDTILGGYGDGDTLIGGEGRDRVEGGGGSDEISGGIGDDDLTGDHFGADLGADTILGEDGDDTINGSGGADSVVGGVGNDIVIGDFGNDMVVGGEGDDVVYGSYHDDTLIGGDGADRIGGGQGVNVARDYLDGVDTLLAETATFEELTIVQDGADVVISHNDEWGGVSSLRLLDQSADQITVEDFLFLRQGTAEDDSLTGGTGDDYVTGGDGDDTLNGGDGGDDVEGGAGDDTVTGGGGDDTVGGGEGDDTLSGGLGADTLSGGGGDDVFVVGAGDSAEEGAGEGTDTVVSSSSFTLGSNIENLTLGDGASGAAGAAMMADMASDGPMAAKASVLNGAGNALNNAITGSSGANGLWGLDGKDLLIGNGGNDRLFGGRGNDKLAGGDGADVLQGDYGKDKLTGGAGADTFKFAASRDSGDLIRDFTVAKGDLIDISAIDARADRAGDQAFTFVGHFHGRDGEAVLTYNTARDRTTLQLDVDGDGKSDFDLTMDGHVASTEGWVL